MVVLAVHSHLEGIAQTSALFPLVRAPGSGMKTSLNKFSSVPILIEKARLSGTFHSSVPCFDVFSSESFRYSLSYCLSTRPEFQGSGAEKKHSEFLTSRDSCSLAWIDV
jgi:hypothetical protein